MSWRLPVIAVALLAITGCAPSKPTPYGHRGHREGPWGTYLARVYECDLDAVDGAIDAWFDANGIQSKVRRLEKKPLWVGRTQDKRKHIFRAQVFNNGFIKILYKAPKASQSEVESNLDSFQAMLPEACRPRPAGE